VEKRRAVAAFHKKLEKDAESNLGGKSMFLAVSKLG